MGLLGVTAAEWLGLFVILLSGSAGAAWFTGWAALRKVKVDAETQRQDAKLAARETAVSEVNIAMEIYSRAVARLNDEVRVLTVRVDECEARHIEHNKICPLNGDRT